VKLVKLMALLAAVVIACCAAATTRATTQPALLMHVKVGLLPTKITLSSNHAARGLEVEFSVRNRTAARRIVTIAGKRMIVPANALRITAISFQARGRYAVVSRTATSRVTTIFRVQ
jgi:hypothetical protein